MNKLLKRQIKKHLKNFSEENLKEMDVFFKAIEEAYQSFDNDRILMERSLNISSKELLEKNKNLQRKARNQKEVLKGLKSVFKEFIPNVDSLFFTEKEDSEFIISLTKSLKEMIHERKINEEKIILQAKEIEAKKEDLEKFKQAADCIDDQVIFTNPNGIIIYANQKTAEVTGFSLEKEIIGHKSGTLNLWGNLMPKGFYQNLWKTIKRKKETFIGEIKNKKKDGTVYIVEAKISPVLDKDKNILFFVGILRDITKAKEVDRLKSEFISIASHQLRTPLSSLKWVLEMLLDESMGNLNQKQKKLMIQCSNSNERMIDLVNDLLNVSRIEMGTLNLNLEHVCLKTVINSLLSELDPLIKEKSQNIDFKFSKNLSHVLSDESYTRQILLNFISNAIKYTPKKGNITIKLTKKKNLVLCEIIDNGLGIPEAEQKNIFTKFYRATNVSESNVEGSGLGLYIVKSIIEKSGGKVGFKSEENKGSNFYFTLPTEKISKKTKIK